MPKIDSELVETIAEALEDEFNRGVRIASNSAMDIAGEHVKGPATRKRVLRILEQAQRHFTRTGGHNDERTERRNNA